jgi:hypothetical protein
MSTHVGGGGVRPGAGRPKGAVSAQTKTIKAIARALTLENPAVVRRLEAEAISGAMPPNVFIDLLNRGWGKPIQTEEETSEHRSLAFISARGLVWDLDPFTKQESALLAAQRADELLAAEHRAALDRIRTEPASSSRPARETVIDIVGEELELVREPGDRR